MAKTTIENIECLLLFIWNAKLGLAAKNKCQLIKWQGVQFNSFWMIMMIFSTYIIATIRTDIVKLVMVNTSPVLCCCRKFFHNSSNKRIFIDSSEVIYKTTHANFQHQPKPREKYMITSFRRYQNKSQAYINLCDL